MTNEDKAREELKLCMKRVPDAVNSGSYQMAVGFKGWAGRATKAVNNPATKLVVLQSLINEYRSYK